MALTFDQITAITNSHYMPKFPELVFDQNPTLSRLHRKGTKPQSGQTIKQPVMYQMSKGDAYQPFDTFDISAEDQVTAADFNWKYYEVPITLSRDEILKNDGPEGIRKLLDAKMKLARMRMGNLLSTAITAIGAASGSDSSADIHSLDSMINNAADTLASLPGTTTYGGIDKNLHNFWAGTVTSGDGTERVDYQLINTAWFDVIDGNQMPTFLVGHNNSVQKYYDTQQSQQRYMKQSELDGGFMAAEFNGRPFFADLNISDTGTTTEADNRIYLINEDFVDLVSHAKENMRLEPFAKPVDQAVQVAHIFWAGELTSSDPGRSCALRNFDSLAA